MLSILGKIFSRRHFDIFFLFSKKTEFDNLCKLSPMETVCIKRQIMFSGKHKKNITNLSFAELDVNRRTGRKGDKRVSRGEERQK